MRASLSFVICLFKHLSHHAVGKSDDIHVIDPDSSHEQTGDSEGKSLIAYVFPPAINLETVHIFLIQSLRR